VNTAYLNKIRKLGFPPSSTGAYALARARTWARLAELDTLPERTSVSWAVLTAMSVSLGKNLVELLFEACNVGRNLNHIDGIGGPVSCLQCQCGFAGGFPCHVDIGGGEQQYISHRGGSPVPPGLVLACSQACVSPWTRRE